MKRIEGNLNGAGLRIGIVVSRFHPTIASRLLEGTQSALIKAGVSNEAITVAFVPGTYEIPFLAKKLAQSKKVDAIIALGCVLRGETIHFDVICQATGHSLQRMALETGVPITSGIIMADEESQAMERSSDRQHRGVEAAHAAISLANASKTIL